MYTISPITHCIFHHYLGGSNEMKTITQTVKQMPLYQKIILILYLVALLYSFSEVDFFPWLV